MLHITFARIRRKTDRNKFFFLLYLLEKKMHGLLMLAVIDSSMCHEVKEIIKSNNAKLWLGNIPGPVFYLRKNDKR